MQFLGVDMCPLIAYDELDDRAFGGIARLVDPKACVGCAMCEEVCAKNAIIVKDNRSFSVRNPRLASAYSYSRSSAKVVVGTKSVTKAGLEG